ncbi:MAG: hypothetical protein JWN04_5410 [Myxococcaceae bacterium]|nr:hypothetical protein [Myxococcaceae bacterium]
MARHIYKVGRPPREDGPTENVTFRLALDEHANLKAHAAARDLAKAALIREALEQCGLLTPLLKKRGS